jgi:NADH-quinone oxidoreductase subunit N
MTTDAWSALMPLTCLAAAAVVLLLLIPLHRRHAPAAAVALVGLAAALAVLPDLSGGRVVPATPLLSFDGRAVVYLALFGLAGAATILLAYGYLQAYDGRREEFYLLVVLAVLGASVLAVGTHFAALFLGLEILSIALYALIAYPHRTGAQLEAAVKYLILAAVSSAFLLFGIALFYAGSGHMTIGPVAALLGNASAPSARWLAAGVALMVVAVGFKLAVVPFHLWTPDVYQGAPPPIAAFVATVSKGAVVALLMRLLPPGELPPGFITLFTLVAMASMIAGNLLALRQQNIKRILGYSSIAHMGYLLVAYLAGGPAAAAAVTFYLATYFVTTLGAFGVVTLLSGPDKDAEELDDYRGLFWRRPWLAGVLVLMVFSLAGLPLTAGFPGKFYLVVAGVAEARWMLVITLAVTSTIGLYYYLRIVVTLFDRRTETAAPPVDPSLAGRLTLAGLTAALVWIGVLPEAVIAIIRNFL